MTEKPHPPSTQTATPNQSLSPPKSFSPPVASSTATISPSSPSLLPHSSTAATPDHVVVAAQETGPALSTVQVGGAADAELAAEEEPYTIKCICGYQGDDGNTIYCEICDSWQHIECFYPNNAEEATREEFSHACHECKPRPLDQKHAVAYQQRRLEAATAEAATPEAVENTKTKRPPSKSHGQSHKKKPKPSDLQLNGHGPSASDVSKHPPSAHDGHSAHPTKKAKSSHKSSQSLGGSHTKRSPSYSASRTNFQNGHPLSPATTPPDLPDGVEIHNYSSDFLSLCSEQNAAQIVQTNSFASLAVSNATSIWLREPERMRHETGHEYSEVFHELPPNYESAGRLPQVEVKKRVMAQDPIVRWSYLATAEAVDKDVRLMELNGQVGFQKDYCAVPMNRYEELSCPLPFVFFHPLLPLYIDTRREGSLARYVRRSCRPNTVLDTFLSGGSQYHFWLLSDRRIQADEQITIPWDFRLPHDAKARMFRILGLGDDESNTHDDIDVEEEEYNSIARWVHLILSEYGGCACDLGNDCAFARFHRNYGGRVHHGRNGQGNHGGHTKKKTTRKTKTHALSPTSTGHATNSRAASEGHADDLTENEKASTSSRSKPPSRDMTPAPRQGSFDTLGILTEPTDRDKRKVAMVEDSFRRLEQQPPRKKKRTSDGSGVADKSVPSHSRSKSKSSSTTNGSGANHGEHSELANGVAGRHYVDAGTSRSKPSSPISVASPHLKSGTGHGFAPLVGGRGMTPTQPRPVSVGPPPTYCDAGVQTDPTSGEWYSETVSPPRRRRRVVSLSRRLLSHRHFLQVEESQAEKQMQKQKQMPPVPPVPQPQPQLQVQVQVQPQVQPEKQVAEAPSGMDVDDAKNGHEQLAPKSGADQAEDVPMADASTGTSEPVLVPATQSSPAPPAAAAVDNAAVSAIVDSGISLTPVKSTETRVPLPQATPLHVTPVVATPLTGMSILQSPMTATAIPFGLVTTNGAAGSVTPSPVKKKMSLSDYTKSRKAAGNRPAVGTSLKPFTSHVDEPKSATSADGTSVGGSPTAAEKGTEVSLGTPTVSAVAGGSE